MEGAASEPGELNWGGPIGIVMPPGRPRPADSVSRATPPSRSTRRRAGSACGLCGRAAVRSGSALSDLGHDLVPPRVGRSVRHLVQLPTGPRELGSVVPFLPVRATLPRPDDHPTVRRPQQLTADPSRLLLGCVHALEHEAVPLLLGFLPEGHVRHDRHHRAPPSWSFSVLMIKSSPRSVGSASMVASDSASASSSSTSRTLVPPYSTT